MQPNWTIEDLADDYALCAKWAVESGADVVETNFSCPNVSSCDGQLYQNAVDAGLIAERVRSSIGETPYLLKIGHFTDPAKRSDDATKLLQAVAPFADGIATTNSIATTIANANGDLLFDGQRRGICGDGTRTESIRQTEVLSRIIREHDLALEIVGVGGIENANHVESYIHAGAQAVQLATSPMLDPLVGIKIRETLATRDRC
jgi:dihydroorotate dehydrogenase